MKSSSIRTTERGLRKRSAAWMLGLGVAAVIIYMQRETPKETPIEVRLGNFRAETVEARILYEDADEAVQSVVFRYPTGAPSRLKHTPRLPGGAYTVNVALLGVHGTLASRQFSLAVPSEGVVRYEFQGSTRGSPRL